MKTFKHTDGKLYAEVERGTANSLLRPGDEVMGRTSVEGEWNNMFFGYEKKNRNALCKFSCEHMSGGTITCDYLARPITAEEILKPYAIEFESESEWNAVRDALGDAKWSVNGEYIKGRKLLFNGEVWLRSNNPADLLEQTVITAREAMALLHIDYQDQSEVMESIARLESDMEKMFYQLKDLKGKVRK